MRTKGLFSIVTAACMVLGLAAAADAHPKKVYQTTDVFLTSAPATQPGGATLVRSRNGAEMRIGTAMLTPNNVYTVWWVVFNNPAACSVPCNANDLTNPAVRAAVFYAAGFITGVDGIGNVSAHMSAGSPPEGLAVVEGTAKGLEHGNGFDAEIHLVIRTHGAAINGRVDEQISSFGGACEVNLCMNQQAAVFKPVQ